MAFSINELMNDKTSLSSKLYSLGPNSIQQTSFFLFFGT